MVNLLRNLCLWASASSASSPALINLSLSSSLPSLLFLSATASAITLSPLALKFMSPRRSFKRSDCSTTGLKFACLRSGGFGTAGRALISASCNARLSSRRRRSRSSSSSAASLASRSSRRRRRSLSSTSSRLRSSERVGEGDLERCWRLGDRRST